MSNAGQLDGAILALARLLGAVVVASTAVLEGGDVDRARLREAQAAGEATEELRLVALPGVMVIDVIERLGARRYTMDELFAWIAIFSSHAELLRAEAST